MLSQRPFVNYYGPTFILYELSSPFLNFHWFFDKLQMTGSKPQWYNGILLLGSFLCCRLLWGTYQSIRVYQDVWAALHLEPNLIFPKPTAVGVDATAGSGLWPANTVFEPLGESDEIMRYASTGAGGGGMTVPSWLALVYLGSNIVLNTLNFYWFGKMIETVRSRFREPQAGRRQKWKAGKMEPGRNDNRHNAAEAEPEGVMVEGLVDSSTILGTVSSIEAQNGTLVPEVGGEGQKKVNILPSSSGTSLEVEGTETRRRRKG